MSKFRTPGNKRSFVRSARSLERAINGAPRPPAPGSGAFPARAVRGDPRNCSAGADEGLRVCDGTPGTRRAGALPSGLSVGAPRMGPRGDSAVQCRQSGGSGHAAPKNRWLQDTRGPLPRAKPMRETPLRSWVCAPGKNGGFSPCVGTAEGKNPALRPGAWHGSRGLLRALRPAEPAVRGGCPGRRGRQCPPGVAGTPPVAQRRQPPFPGGRCHLWKAPGIHRAGEDAPGSAAFLCGTVGTRPARARRFPGGAVEHQRGFGRHGPQYRLPGGGCAARSRGGGGTRPGTGAELHLPGPVVSPTGQSLRNRAITIEGAERSSSAQVLTGVPEARILSLPLCPSTPRSLRSSASPLRSPELKGSNRTRCRPRRWPGLSHVHGGTLPPVTTSPPEPPGKPCPVMNSMSNTSTRKLTLTGISGVLWAVGIAAAGTHPRSLLLGPDTPALPGSNPGGTVGYRCRRSEQLPSCPRAARKRKGSVSGARLGPPLGQNRESAVPVVPRGPGSSPPPSAQPGECPRKQGARVESGSGARSALRGGTSAHRHPRPPGEPARVGLGAVMDPVVLDAGGRETEQLLKHGHRSTRESRGTAPLRCGDRCAAASGRGGLRTPFGSGRNCPGTVPPAAASSRTAAVAPSHFSFRAKTPTSGRSPGPGSSMRGGFGWFPRDGGRSALLSPLRSRLHLALSLPPPPPHLNRAQPRPRAGSAQPEPQLLPSAPLRAAAGLLRAAAQFRAGDGAKAAAQSGATRPLRAPVWRRYRAARPRIRDSNLHRGHRQPRCRADTNLLGLRQPHGHGNGRRCASTRRARGTRSASDPQPRDPRRALRPLPPEGKIHERLRLVSSVVNGAAGAHSALRVPLSGQPTDTENASLRGTGLKGCPALPEPPTDGAGGGLGPCPIASENGSRGTSCLPEAAPVSRDSHVSRSSVAASGRRRCLPTRCRGARGRAGEGSRWEYRLAASPVPAGSLAVQLRSYASLRAGFAFPQWQRQRRAARATASDRGRLRGLRRYRDGRFVRERFHP
ncbi:collagen alpha-1(I) chain-like [Corvus kubaryi]|uniref:collagen alpha-1(I) chain-like n=1 Tax=Corvus kubaryi TaxID=68294 RepID=UPI001C051850|nr:collagen alpha-1(I) chain-like [Corvus kubaryi]